MREKRQRSQLLILVLLIANSVTRYFVQQGRMFLKSVLSCQVAAITLEGLVSGFLSRPLIWVAAVPKEPSIWISSQRLLEVALEVTAALRILSN